MDVLNGISTPGHIKIMVEPIGEISGMVFEKYYSIIKNDYHTLPLFNLTRFTKENQKSPFENQNWKTAKLRMSYILSHGEPIAPPKRDQNVAQRIHAYIGIMTCKNRIKPTYMEYESRIKQLSFIKDHRLLAVEYLPQAEKSSQKSPTSEEEEETNIEEDDYEEEDVNDLKDLIIILPSKDHSKLKFYVERAMSDLLNCLVRTFEKNVKKYKKLPKNNNNNHSSDVAVLKKYADYALLIGDIVGATEINKRIIGTKSSSSIKDVTMAQAKENLITCLYFSENQRIQTNLRNSSSLSPDEEKQQKSSFKNIVMKHFNDLIEFYEKKKYVYPHLIQSMYKYILFLKELSSSSSLISTNSTNSLTNFDGNNNFGGESNGDNFGTLIIENLNKLLELTIEKKGVNVLKGVSQRRIVYEKLVQLYDEVGYSRKTGFLYLRLAKLYYKEDELTKAMNCVIKAFPSYNIPITITNNQLEWKVESNDVGLGWTEIQTTILKELTLYSSRNPLFRCRVMLYLLSNYYSVLDKVEQEWLFNELDKVFANVKNRPSKKVKICVNNFPIFIKVVPKKTPDPPFFEKEKTDENIFLFIPKQFKKRRKNQKKEKILWVVNEPVEVELYLYNPFERDITLRTVQLKVNIECVIYATGHILRKKEILKLKLYLLPKVCGNLRIESVSFYINKIPNKIEIPILGNFCEGKNKRKSIKKGDKIETKPIQDEKSIELENSIQVIDRIPKCVCRFSIPNLTLYEGEEIINRLIIQNISDCKVNMLRIKVLNGIEDVIEYDQDLIERNLPLGEKEMFSLPVKIGIKERTNKERSLKDRVFVFQVLYGGKIEKKDEEEKKEEIEEEGEEIKKETPKKEEKKQQQQWVRKKKVSLKVKCCKSLKIIRDEGKKSTKIANVSSKNFVVYMKNGRVVPVPPNYTKEIPMGDGEPNIPVYYKSPNNLRVNL